MFNSLQDVLNVQGNALQCNSIDIKQLKQSTQLQYYLCRNENQLNKLPYLIDMSIIANSRLCINCWSGNSNCSSNPTHMHAFQTIESMLQQLKSEQVCPYTYFNSMQNPRLVVGTHYDIMNSIYSISDKFNNATIIFDDCHDLPSQFERAASIHLCSKNIKTILLQFHQCSNNQMGWEQQFYSKNKLTLQKQPPDKQIKPNQSEMDAIIPLISFNLQIMQYLQETYKQSEQIILNCTDAYKIITTCTKQVSIESVIKYFKQQRLTIVSQWVPSKYIQLSGDNFEEYLDHLYELCSKQPRLYELLYPWFHFIKLSFDLSYAEQVVVDSNSLSEPSNDRVSIDELSDIHNGRDYKLVILYDIIIGSYSMSLICLNPAVPAKLLSDKVANIVVSSKYLHPLKLNELGLTFNTITTQQTPISKLDISIIIKTALNMTIDFSNNYCLDQLALEIGKQILQTTQQLNEHGCLVLFASNSFMQQCQDIWSKHNIMQSISQFKDINWLKYPTKPIIYEGIKIFLNKCRRQQDLTELMPATFAHCNESLLDQLQSIVDNMAHQISQHAQPYQHIYPITVYLVGVPWANSTMYAVDSLPEQLQQIHFDLKLEWLKRYRKQMGRKHFSLINAIRTTSRLVGILNGIDDCNLVLVDDKFQWKQLWQTDTIPTVQNHQDLLTRLNEQHSKITKLRTQQQQQPPQPPQQIIKISINKNTGYNAKRKLMLNKVLLGDRYPMKQAITTMDEVMGFTEERKKLTEDDDSTKCVICWGNHAGDLMKKSNKCGHVACAKCWEKWLETKLECPICRARVRPKFLDIL